MPRRREVPKRDILPDPKFGNVEVSKFINAIMQSGKKSVAERIVYGAFDIITTKSGKDPLEVFLAAVANVKPAHAYGAVDLLARYVARLMATRDPAMPAARG